MATLTRGFECMSDRYKYDFRLCTSANGWAQLDTKQDASYFGNWINPFHPQANELLRGRHDPNRVRE